MYILRRLFAIVIMVLVTKLVLFLIYSSFQGTYYYSYEHSQWSVDDFRRLPLWYPFEISECRDDGSKNKFSRMVRMYDLRSFPKYYSPDDSEERLALQWLNDIQKFNATSNALWGVRSLYARKLQGDGNWEKRHLGDRYFIFTTNMEGVVYFKNKSDYEERCHGLNVAPWELKSFEEKFREFQKTDHGDCPSEVIRFALTKGLSASDAMWVFVPLVFWVVVMAWGIRVVVGKGNHQQNENP